MAFGQELGRWMTASMFGELCFWRRRCFSLERASYLGVPWRASDLLPIFPIWTALTQGIVFHGEVSESIPSPWV